MITSGGFVIKAAKELKPCYRLSPVSATSVAKNRNLPESGLIDDYFNGRFGHNYYYTLNGRSAIGEALKDIGITKNAKVAILTTSGNRYISRCVTDEIEKYCKWTRNLEEATGAILVNHEFGFPYSNLVSLKKYGLPLIEDCAYSFFSTDKYGQTGKAGDYIVYSFPKIFPVQCGGLLVSKKELKNPPEMEVGLKSYLRKVLSYYIMESETIKKKRLLNSETLEKKLGEMGFSPRFECNDAVIPGVFLFNTNGVINDHEELKKFMQDEGVECSVFYGEEAFFIPVHQNLCDDDLDYFCELLRIFIQGGYDNI